MHNWERWFEEAAAPGGASFADRFGTGAAATNPFQINAGNSLWGGWVQILGSGDTPADAGMRYFDLHRIGIVASQRTTAYCVQIGFGASGAAALAAGTYTEFIYLPTGTVGEQTIIDIISERQLAGTLAWARCIAPGQNLGTLDFYFGLHEYIN